MGKIETGDAELDQVLELENELKGHAYDMLDNEGLETVVGYLCHSMNASSATEALRRFAELTGQPEPEEPGTPTEGELSLVLEKYSNALRTFVLEHAAQQDPEEVVELLVESIDGANTRQILDRRDSQDPPYLGR